MKQQSGTPTIDQGDRPPNISAASAKGDQVGQNELVGDWRHRFLKRLLLVAVIFGFVAAVPSIILSFNEKLYIVAIFDIVMFILTVVLYLRDSLGYLLRARIVSIAVFAIGMILMTVLGPNGGGPIWLFAFPVIVGVLLGTRAAYFALGLNFLVLSIFGLLFYLHAVPWKVHAANPLMMWIVLIVNFLLLNTLTTVSLTSLLQTVYRSLQKERNARGSLKEQSEELADVNERLVTEIEVRQKSEADLRTSEERYRALMMQSADMLLLHDLEGKLLDVNEQACRNYGYSRAELLQMSVADLDPDYDKRSDSKAFFRQMEPGKPQVFEARQSRKDGSEFPAEIRLSVVEIGGKRHIQGLGRDISEKKKAEQEQASLQQQLQQAQKMESVGRLAGGIAHDFNNLLTTISGNAELVLMDLGDSDPGRPLINEINKAADSAAALTHQLLAFSRKQVIEPKVIDINALITHIQPMLTRLIGEDISLQTDCARPVGNIKADPGQIEQILVNMAVNARHAMPGGGHLFLETANIELDANYCRKHPHVEPGAYVQVAISDDGHGMDMDTQQRVFDPFFTTKPAGEGTGLGLATVYGIVKQHDGHIEVYSEPNKGTTFKVYFPLIGDHFKVEPAPSPVSDIPHGKETVLIVEDDPMVREIAIRILTRQGYAVFAADSGASALELIEREAPVLDLLMTDIVMPKMNGRELAETLTDKLPNLKVLYTSGYTRNIIAQHGILDEGINFMGKPYTPKSLARKVRDVLDG